MAEKKETALEKRNKAELAVTKLFESTSGEGFEGMSSDDLAIPFLVLLQKMSPQVDKDDGAYIKGAEAGMYLDTATGEVMEEVTFIVCHYHRAMVEWRDRDSGGGFVAQHPVGYERDFEREMRGGKWTGRWITEENRHLADTRYFFGLRVKSDGTVAPGVLSFSSTQIKKARAWNTKMRTLQGVNSKGVKFQLPVFAGVWSLTSVPEENEQGKWSGYKIEQTGTIEDPVLAEVAQQSREMFKSAASQFTPTGEASISEEDSDLPF